MSKETSIAHQYSKAFLVRRQPQKATLIFILIMKIKWIVTFSPFVNPFYEACK